MTDFQKLEWAEEARMRAVVGSCPRSMASVASGLRLYFAFVDKAFPAIRRYFPPQLEVLMA
eukprot:8437929-Karenia_brevis.AAC.1